MSGGDRGAPEGLREVALADTGRPGGFQAGALVGCLAGGDLFADEGAKQFVRRCASAIDASPGANSACWATGTPACMITTSRSVA
ncbi:MAG TPA: hypothetical protein VFE45_06690, partial [Coriobacteriia bacterium]|nr:hypothetical protein [Coriobacteriia bacterium]